MRTSERIAIDVPPIFLRLVLAVTFLWAGLGKILGDMTVEGPAAQRLAAMGVDLGQDAAPPPPTRTPKAISTRLPIRMLSPRPTPQPSPRVSRTPSSGSTASRS